MKRKNAFAKDFFMEIRKSLGRFLSIFFIVALGVSLFVGIRATEPDMRISGDAYVDENKLMDIKVVSTYGLTEIICGKRDYEKSPILQGLQRLWKVVRCAGFQTVCNT